jgi:hypothetical protein
MAIRVDRLTQAFRSLNWVLLARAGLCFCIAITLIFAFSPPKDGFSLFPWDKADHFTAYFVLMSGSIISFPNHRLITIAFWVSLSGAAIELIQGTPLVHRDCDVWDWVAENIAILAVVGVIIVAKLRRESAKPQERAI